ncbi:hypothetical protein ACQI4L_06945 [Mycolicibacterium litorale]|uniref:hypothetical protein n=1 Tax=Mycolicibacterium litorale TaxID=758802 RepID=UPI003CF75EB7
MSMTFESAPGPALSDTFEATVESPFLELPALGVPPNSPGQLQASVVPESPFVSEYVLGERTIRPEEPALAELFDQLYDNEFDEALTDLASEAETYVAELGLGETESDSARAEQMLETWIEPLRRETQAMLVGMAEAIEMEDPQSIPQHRLNEIFEQFEPEHTEHGPSFENFLKKVFTKAKTLAAGAIDAAKTGIAAVSKVMPVGIILRKLAVLARPMLTRVLKFALDKLPPEYRDPAQQLARRFLGAAVAESADEIDSEDLDLTEWETEDGLTTHQQPASADIRQIQEDFDADAVALVFAPSESEQDLYLAESTAASVASVPSPLSTFDAARHRFVDGLTRLDEGVDPTPLVENFVPAILPALRLGIKLAGRPRVVGFLSQYLARLMSPYVGPSVTPGLSRAIVDAGLRMMTLEAESQDTETPSTIAAEAFASLVEDTVARVAELDEAELEEELIVQEATYTAFHESAGANFPAAVLSPQNDYVESGRAGGAWVPMPRGGPTRYRKYSRAFNVVIHPAATRSITTFGGQPLSAFIRDRLGRRGPVRARIHLYQAVPGSSLARIARMERGVPGLGSADARARSRLHPLTPMAAAALIGEPGLGREVPETYTEGNGPLAIGQRLYFLETTDAASEPVATGSDTTAGVGAGSGDAAPARMSDARVDVDPASGLMTVTIYASESDAQSIAMRLRRREPLGPSLAVLRRIYAPAISRVRGPGSQQRVRVVSEARNGVETEDLIRHATRPGRPLIARRSPLRPTLRRPGRYRRPPRRVRRRPLIVWTAQSLAAELDRNRDAFLQAVDAPADGVTIVLRLRPPGLEALVAARPAPSAVGSGPGTVQVEIYAGHPRA